MGTMRIIAKMKCNVGEYLRRTTSGFEAAKNYELVDRGERERKSVARPALRIWSQQPWALDWLASSYK